VPTHRTHELTMKRAIILAVLTLVLAASSAHGQANPDSVKLRNDCRLAAQVLQKGNPAPHRQWAGAFIQRCGADEVADANVAALNRLRSSRDTAELKQVWNQLQYVRDARIYRAAVSIAGDRTASVPARVSALLWLLRLRAPDQFATEREVTGGFDAAGHVRGGCGRYSHLVGSSPFLDGQPLPAGFGAEITELGRLVSSDASQPLDVRTAARCAQTLGYGRR
jgi:hypothetical protein